MIYKLTTYRRLARSIFLIIAVLSLGACSTFSGMLGQATNNEASADEPAQNTVDSSLEMQGEALSVEELQALQDRQATLSLVSMPNKYLQEAQENTPLARAILIKALEAYQGENHVLAMSLLEEAKAQTGGLNSAGYVLAGDIYSAQTEDESSNSALELAMQNFRDALSLNPNNYKAANRLAALLREQGEFVQALELYNNAIEAYPGYALSYRNRGILYDLYLGNKQAAYVDYQQYEKLLEIQQAFFVQKQEVEKQEAQQQEQGATQPSVMTIAPEHVREFLSQDTIKRELRRVKGWIRDVGRQAEQNLSRINFKDKELAYKYG